MVCVRSRGGVPTLHTAVPRGAAPSGALPSRVPSSRGRGVQRARGAGYRPTPPIVQDMYRKYVSVQRKYIPLQFDVKALFRARQSEKKEKRFQF